MSYYLLLDLISGQGGAHARHIIDTHGCTIIAVESRVLVGGRMQIAISRNEFVENFCVIES
jgi:hypothetical protein